MKEKVFLEELTTRYPELKVCIPGITEAFELMKQTYEAGNKVLVAGNGGSCADADHIVGELMKGFCLRRQIPAAFAEQMKIIDAEAGNYLEDKLQGALPTIALHTQSALSTAYLNDVDGKSIFAQTLYGYGMKGDCFLAISTSGNSRNVLYAAVVAKAKGMKVIGLTGRDGGKLKAVSDASIIVPEEETFKIQELHLPIYHCICLMLENYFFGGHTLERGNYEQSNVNRTGISL